jgi:hypothetical protein
MFVATNYEVHEYSNEEICYSILKKMTLYNCNNSIVLFELSTICKKIELDFTQAKIFEIVDLPEINLIYLGDVIFSLP